MISLDMWGRAWSCLKLAGLVDSRRKVLPPPRSGWRMGGEEDGGVSGAGEVGETMVGM